MDLSLKTLEHLRCDHRDPLDKSGPKIARHKSIYDNLTSAEKSPYIPLHIEDMVYHGIRKCCEINSKGYPTDRSSSHVFLLRPFSENEFDNGILGNFNLLLKRMKNESVDWDASFNIRATPTHLQDPIWLFWLHDVLSSFPSMLKKLAFILPEHLHRISGLPILGEFYEEYAPTNDILYSNKISSTCRALFGIYANNNSKKLGHWTSYFVEPNEDSFQRRQNISNDVYLVGFLASWLSGFVLPHSSNSNEVRPSTFVVASKMARGSIFSLAVPVLTCLYQCFNRVAVSSHPGKHAVHGPFQFFFGWISLYFQKTYSRGSGSPLNFGARFFPYLGLIGNQATGDFYLNKSPYAQTLFVFSDNYYPRALTSEDEPKGRIKDDDNLSPFLLSYLVCLRPGILTFKFSSLFLSEPYAPNRYARQFGFGQACPKVVDVSYRAALSSDPPLLYYQWCEMMRRRTNVVIELPSPQFRARVTEPYARWWIASSFVILQFSLDLKRKQPNPQSKTPKKKTKKPTILDSPYSPPRHNTLPSGCSSNKSTNSSSLMSLATRRCPDTTTKPSPRRYPQQYLLNILETRCHNFCGKLIRFEFEDPKTIPSPLELTFPESSSPLKQFRAYIDSLFEGEDSIFEGKDAQAVVDKFENGHELLVLGRVKAKSIGTPSHSLPFEYSASVSNYSRKESKNDVIEVEDEDGQSPDHFTMSLTPSGSPKHDDHVSSTNSWQAASSNLLPSSTPQIQNPGEISFDDMVDPVELEGLIARIEKPPAQSDLISSNEAAGHIQRGLLLSLQSSTISIDDIISRTNGVISILKGFSVDLSPLYEKVKTLVKCSALWAKVADTSSGDAPLGELEAQYEEKQAKLEEMTNSYGKMSSLVSKLTKRISSLEEEVIRTREQLKKLESELSSCKAKQSSSQNDFIKCSENISNFEKDLEAAKDAVEQRKKKGTHYDAVKEALDAAGASLMN
ncbi:hypothetical protein Vadar_018885 [Vaccinium darrowii]|uniref:Uncharacterized protein n=1 Tax=Vaccinium darrowii TaxID=229202 RepID=A0ACB7ZD82_9ERIC|nr:hypothetical protein Vadar_018885 [Vaccinium darrowii]